MQRDKRPSHGVRTTPVLPLSLLAAETWQKHTGNSMGLLVASLPICLSPLQGQETDFIRSPRGDPAHDYSSFSTDCILGDYFPVTWREPPSSYPSGISQTQVLPLGGRWRPLIPASTSPCSLVPPPAAASADLAPSSTAAPYCL